MVIPKTTIRGGGKSGLAGRLGPYRTAIDIFFRLHLHVYAR
jgi:hypothetical protein